MFVFPIPASWHSQMSTPYQWAAVYKTVDSEELALTMTTHKSVMTLSTSSNDFLGRRSLNGLANDLRYYTIPVPVKLPHGFWSTKQGKALKALVIEKEPTIRKVARKCINRDTFICGSTLHGHPHVLWECFRLYSMDSNNNLVRNASRQWELRSVIGYWNNHYRKKYGELFFIPQRS